MIKWIDEIDCEIVRPDSKNDPSYDIKVPGHVVLMDATDGSRIFVVPNTFTDNQVWECLRIANIAFRCGHTSGERSKANEIARALFLG